MTLAEDGSLLFGFETGEMRESAPVAWQEVEGERVAVAVDFSVRGEREVAFALMDTASYDARYPLVVDPGLTWNTFLGGSGTDYGWAIAVDGSGNVYVAGYSNGTWGTPVSSYTSGYDAFAAKLSSSGSLTWSTFLGGSGNDIGYAIAVDGSGNVYVAGSSTATWGTPVSIYTSGYDAFAAKLSSSGSLIWNTFLGGSGNDYAIAIAVDGSGNVYIAGYSHATWGTPVCSFGGGSQEALAAKLSGSGSLTWNAFLGGSGTDQANAIAVDGSGNVHVAGYSTATWGSPVRSFGCASQDAFATKLSADDAYADPAGACASNSPCFTTLAGALATADPWKTAQIYGGTYAESLSLAGNVTVTLAANAAITGSVSLTTGNLKTNGYTLTVSGDWTNTGGTFNGGSAPALLRSG